MFLLSYYRLYASIAAGGVAYFIFWHYWWAWLLVSLGARLLWFVSEATMRAAGVSQSMRRHLPQFRQEFGPYGIRIANLADSDRRVRNSLAEVFVADTVALGKTVEQLEMLDTLFSAGMRPQGDDYLLHDLKLKYGRGRLSGKSGG